MVKGSQKRKARKPSASRDVLDRVELKLNRKATKNPTRRSTRRYRDKTVGGSGRIGA
jgi:hypothetical protein